MRMVKRSVVMALVLAATVVVAGPHFAVAQDKKDKDKETAAAQDKKDKDKDKATAAAVFELYKDSADEFRFRLKDGEGNLLATSGKGYATKADCQKVIDAIKSAVAKAKVEEVK
jgi:uncharacterized protein YegP (UPF0339 family)